MEPQHETMRRLLEWLEARIRSFYPAVGEPEIHVVCSSRPAPHLCIKHSYHLVVSNLVFANNHDGTISLLCDSALWLGSVVVGPAAHVMGGRANA